MFVTSERGGMVRSGSAPRRWGCRRTFDGQQVRSVQAGAEEEQLDVLRATQASAAGSRSLTPGWRSASKRLFTACWLRKRVAGAGILRQLARLSRWRDREEDSHERIIVSAAAPDPGLRPLSWKGARRLRKRAASSTDRAPRFRSARLMGASLLVGRKEWSPITLQFKSQGPIGGVVADARPDGSVRGYVHVPQLAFPIADVPRIAHAALGNRGAAQLVRETESGLSTGQVELVTGGIDRDIEALVGASDGERCAVGLGVFVAPGADEESFEITGATGAMVMALPDADPYAFDDVARRVRALSDIPWEGSITDLVSTLAGSYRMRRWRCRRLF